MVHAMTSNLAVLSLCGLGVEDLRDAPDGAKLDCVQCVRRVEDLMDTMVRPVVLVVDDGGAPGEDLLA